MARQRTCTLQAAASWLLLATLGCSAEVGPGDQQEVDATSEALASSSDHRWEFDRSRPPEGDLDAERVEARESLSDLLDVLETRSRSSSGTWAAASEHDLRRIGELTMAASSPSTRDAWTGELEAVRGRPGGPSAAQEAALAVLEAESMGDFQARWSTHTGSPAEIGPFAFARRSLSPAETWEAFASRHSVPLETLFGLSGRCQPVLADTVLDGSGQFSILRFNRTCDGVPVDGELLRAYVTTAESPAGDGVLWKLLARWRPGLSHILPAGTGRAWLTAAQAREAVGADEEAYATLRYSCGERCMPRWQVHLSDERVVTVDAKTGERGASWDPRLHGGPIYIGTYPPGATSLTPSLFRGADVIDFDGIGVGWTDLEDGTYTLASGREAYQIGHAGGMPTSGTWPAPRVDRRWVNSWNAVRASRVLWWPSIAPTQDFSNPDLWPPNSSLQHASSIVYGWLSYWQDAVGRVVDIQVPDTASYWLMSTGGTGWQGCSTQLFDTGPPGSGQSTWGRIACGWGSTDNVSTDPTDDMGGMAHEYGHTILTCASTAGSSCYNKNPGSSTWRPAVPNDWKRDVWDASVENQANMVSAILTEFRDQDEGGYGGGAYEVYRPDWTYAGYASTTDDFGTALQDSAGMIDCTNPMTPCPGGYTCVVPTDEHPVNPNGGVCARMCSTDADCQQGLYCSSGWSGGTQPSTDQICWKNAYVNAWFTNVGGRLAMAAGWKRALRAFGLANSGNSDNGTRDFAVGSDTWYGELVDADIATPFEVTRAVRSASVESATPRRDDFTSLWTHAIPITVIDTTGTPVWWGNGTWEYPNFEHYFDLDMVMFRGLAGSNYEITAQPVSGSPVDLRIEVHRWESGFPEIADSSAPSGPSATVQTGSLSQTAWYVALFRNRVGTSGAWHGRIKLLSGSDELPNSRSEAYPMPSGVPRQAAFQSAYDSDRFGIHVPVTGTSLTVTASTSPAPWITLYRPSGSHYMGGYAPLTLSSVPQTGQWTWKVYDVHGIPRSYTTQADLGCASWSSGSCDDLTGDPPVGSRWAWGDRLAGRLPTGSSWADYSIHLQEAQELSVSLADNSTNNCRLQLDVFGPSDMRYWQGERMYRWQDVPGSGGAAAGDPGGSRLGAGGHITGLVQGTYTLRVSSSNNGAECHYRIFLAKGDIYGTAMPEW